MGRREQLEAELAAEKLAERLVALKEDPNVGPDSEEYQLAKYDLREARRVFRSLRDGQPLEVAPGDAVAKPEPVKASANAKKGGKG